MALLFCDSFDHYTTVSQKWTDGGNTSISAVGRFGTNGLHFGIGQSLGGASVTSPIFTPFQTWIVGAALRLGNQPGASSLEALSIRDGSTVQISLGYDSANQKLLVRRGGSGGTTIITSTRTIALNVYYYVEIKTKIDNTTGTCELWIDGVQDGTFSGDTQQSANASADRLLSAGSTGGNSGLAWDLDDVYILDTTGSIANDVLKDPRIECLFPNGNGNSSQFVGSDGNSVDNYLLVDEAAPNDDTDYVQSPTVGNKDTYTYGDLTTTAGTIYGVQVNTRARKDVGGARQIVSVARLAGTEADSAAIVLPSTYLTYRDIRETKPGGGQWTVSDINSAEFGVKVSA